MGILSSGGMGLDLGSANVTICLQNEGVVLREPSYVLTMRDSIEDILAVGRDAKQMVGRTPKDVSLVSPVNYGAVGDVNLAATLMRTLSEKALGKRRALEKNRLVVSFSQGLTRVELDALDQAVRLTGARKPALARAPVAAAVGAGVPFDDPRGCLMIVIGSMTTQVAVLTMNGVAAARTARTGSASIDEAIMRFVRREKGLIIGPRTAEDLKIDLGSAHEMPNTPENEVSLRGRDARTGKPNTVSINASDIRKAILPPLESMIELIREAFENTPAEMAEDILERGVFLSGGGSQLEGLPEMLGEALGLQITTGAHPQDDVACGACMIASDDRLYDKFLQSGALLGL